MNQEKIKCYKCNHEFDEPKETIAVICPQCGITAILAPKKVKESMIETAKKSKSVYHYFIDSLITVGDKKFKVQETS